MAKEKEAAEKKRELEKENNSGGIWGWVKSKVKAAVKALTDAIDGIFTALRNAVKTIIEAAKNAAIALIEAGRKWIVEKIDGFRTWLKSKVDEYIGTHFPGLAKRINGAIDAVADTAIAGVNFVAENLKKGVALVADTLAKAIDSVLAKFQAGLKGAIRILGAVLTGDLAEALKIAIETACEIAGIDSKPIFDFIDRAKAMVTKILKAPGRFIINIGKALGLGFSNFFKNIIQHLINGVIGWLTGALTEAKITLPETWDLKGIFGLILQILGLTYSNIRAKVVKALGPNGEAIVSGIETTAKFVMDLVTKGPLAVWEDIKQMLVSLKDSMIEAVSSWLITTVIKEGILWLISLTNPASALARLLKMLFDLIMFLIERGKQIVAFVQNVYESIADFVAGNLTKAAESVEKVLARLIPILIGLLASILGLGGISKAVTDVLTKIRTPIDKALDWVVKKIVDLAKAGFNKVFGKGKKGEKEKAKSGKDEYDGEIGKTVNWQAAGESHKIWVDAKGAKPKIMMASTPKGLGDYLEDYKKLADKLDPKSKEKKEVIDKIGKVKGELTQMEQRAAEVKAELAEQKKAKPGDAPSEADEKDDALETQMTAVGPEMKKIRELLGLKSIKEEFAAEFNKMTPEAKTYCLGKLDEFENDPVHHSTTWMQVKTWLEKKGMIFIQPVSRTTLHVDKHVQPKAVASVNKAILSENATGIFVDTDVVDNARSDINAGIDDKARNLKQKLIIFGFDSGSLPESPLYEYFRQIVGLDDESKAIIDKLKTILVPGIDGLIKAVANKKYGKSQHKGYIFQAQRVIFYAKEKVLHAIEVEAGGGRADLQITELDGTGQDTGRFILIEVKHWPDFENLPTEMQEERVDRLRRQLGKFLTQGKVILEWAGAVPTLVKSTISPEVIIKPV